MFDIVSIFDRELVRHHRDRAAEGFAAHDFLFREVSGRLVDRLQDIRRYFPLALELGCRTGGGLTEFVREGQGGVVACLVRSDLSEGMARRAGAQAIGDQPPVLTVVTDEERLPFQTGRFDLVFSNLALHFVNDLPGTLIQIRQVLKPDSLFLASMIGGSSLSELRAAFAEAESAEEGGWSPRVSPFADVRDVGNLLQRTGFVLPVADCDTLTISYPDPLQLLLDLRGMGESNAMRERRRAPLRRGTLKAALDRYHTLHADVAGRVPATVQILYLTAWTPS
ncbi:MAG: SAM-dependent methyltransferase [Rhodospirillaceae bacterium]|nr:MAG: SAM-dependent methyltransferase [Rhodospirillaceae bacterium]